MIPLEERRSLVEVTGNDLSIVRQCQLLLLNRSGLYYTPSSETEKNLEIMRHLDEQYLKTPFYGVERLLPVLFLLGYKANRKRLRRLMKLVGWQTIYPVKNTTMADSKVYKYLYMLTPNPNFLGNRYFHLL